MHWCTYLVGKHDSVKDDIVVWAGAARVLGTSRLAALLPFTLGQEINQLAFFILARVMVASRIGLAVWRLVAITECEIDSFRVGFSQIEDPVICIAIHENSVAGSLPNNTRDAPASCDSTICGGRDTDDEV